MYENEAHRTGRMEARSETAVPDRRWAGTLVALAAALVVQPIPAGEVDPNETLPIVFALEDASPGPATEIRYPPSTTIDYALGIDRVTYGDFEVVYKLDANVTFLDEPTLTIVQGDAAPPPVDVGGAPTNQCLRIAGGINHDSVRFHCSLPLVSSRVYAQNELQLGNIALTQSTGSLCSPTASLDMRIKLVDRNDTSNTLDDSTDPTQGGNADGLPFHGILAMAPASSLNAPEDQGNTRTDLLTPPLPGLGFIDRPGTAIVDADIAGPPSVARAMFELATMATVAPIPQALDGSGAYQLGPFDVVDITLSASTGLHGLASLCIGTASAVDNPFPEADSATCDLSSTATFFDATTTLPLPAEHTVSLATNNLVYQPATFSLMNGIPGDSAFLNAPVPIEATSNGRDRLPLSQEIGLSATVVGHKGCTVMHAGNPLWWKWRSNGVALVAHDIQTTSPTDSRTYTLTNNCLWPIDYFVMVGKKAGANVNALSCGTPDTPNELTCFGTIPGASIQGQPSNRVMNTTTLSLAHPGKRLTARFLLATENANCVHGVYESIDMTTGSRSITHMQRDFDGNTF